MSEKSVTFVKERYAGEQRVMLAPQSVATYTNNGFKVFVETGAGIGSGFEDKDYALAGAIVVSRTDAWAKPYVIKYKGPEPEDFPYFHQNLTLACTFHAEGQIDMVRALKESGVTAYSFEYFETPDGIRPISISDMELTGKLAFLYGAYHLQSHFGGSGVYLGHIHGAPRPKVTVIGYGHCGSAVVRAAEAAGCEVTVLGTNIARLRRFASQVSPLVTCQLNTPENLKHAIHDADLVVGAVLIANDETPIMINNEDLGCMKKGAMIIDITGGPDECCGWLPTFSRHTNYDNPVYSVNGILHCKFDRMPSRVPVTATIAKSNNIVPYVINLGNAIFEGRPDPLSETWCLVADCKLMNPYVIASLPKSNSCPSQRTERLNAQ